MPLHTNPCINPVTCTYSTLLAVKYYSLYITASFAKDELELILIALKGLFFSEGVISFLFVSVLF